VHVAAAPPPSVPSLRSLPELSLPPTPPHVRPPCTCASVYRPTAGEREPVLICHPDTGARVLRVVPSGYEGAAAAPEGAVDLVVSTADGWGDGYHPTTGLSLEFLAKFVDPEARAQVLDYGTGSGVLGIAALKLGCQSVTGIDIDDEALEEVCLACAAAHAPACGNARACACACVCARAFVQGSAA
jgi:hypothetical protein